jgi:5,10-methenyltetrahydromethanopterin hydrogenase
MAGLLRRLVHLGVDAPIEVRVKAVMAVCNVINSGTGAHLRGVVKVNGICAICKILQATKQVALLMAAMEALAKILNIFEEFGLEYASSVVDTYGGIDHIEELQSHPNAVVVEKSLELMQRFFRGVEYIAPADSFDLPPSQQLLPEGHVFGFGGTAKRKLPEWSTPQV